MPDLTPTPIQMTTCERCGATFSDGRTECESCRPVGGKPSPTRGLRTRRVSVQIGNVYVHGPHNSASDKWRIHLGYSDLGLYWQGHPEKAREELASLRAALDFIEGQVLP